MVTQALIDFIKIQLSQNVNPEEIKKQLLLSGWSKEDIESGFRAANAALNLIRLRTGDFKSDPNSEKKGFSVDESVPQPFLVSVDDSVLEEQEEKQEKRTLAINFVKIILGFVFGIVLAWGYYFVWPKVSQVFVEPSPSPFFSLAPLPFTFLVSETTYKNPDFSFEILYPKTWQKTTNLSMEQGEKTLLFESDDDLSFIFISEKSSSTSTSDLSLEKFADFYIKETRRRVDDFNVLGQTPQFLGDLPVILLETSFSHRITSESMRGLVYLAIDFENDRSFIFSFNAEEDMWQEARESYLELAKSLRIL